MAMAPTPSAAVVSDTIVKVSSPAARATESQRNLSLRMSMRSGRNATRSSSALSTNIGMKWPRLGASDHLPSGPLSAHTTASATTPVARNQQVAWNASAGLTSRFDTR
jgi:hypothetical protein